MSATRTVTARTDTVACLRCGQWNRAAAAAGSVPRCNRCDTALPWLTSATDQDFEAVVTAAPVPVLLDLWATWCGPCEALAPGVERAARDFAGRLKAVRVNVAEAPGVTGRYEARSIPLLLILDAGRVRTHQLGAVPSDALLHWVAAAIT